MGIDLLETLRKVMKALIYTCLHTILQLHDVLNRFRNKIVKGTAIWDCRLLYRISA